MLFDPTQYTLLMYDDFKEPYLNETYWLPMYLPQWSSRLNSAPSYFIKDSVLTLYIANDQKPWCPEWNGPIRVSNLQTGVYSGEIGSTKGQHHFSKDLTVREEQDKVIKVAPHYGYIEMKARCSISEENVAALWLIGLEEDPKESAEICLFELKGNHVNKHSAIIGYGVHPFGDPQLTDCFIEQNFNVDVTNWNTYALNWQKDKITFFINGEKVREINESPNYPMQLMLNLYDLKNVKNEKNIFEVDYIKVYQRR